MSSAIDAVQMTGEVQAEATLNGTVQVDTIESELSNAASVSGVIESATVQAGSINQEAVLGAVEIPKSINKYVGYSFAEGDVDGAFEITSERGETESVHVHGLHEIAFDGGTSHLTQNEGDVLVLYCGTASKVV